jgi:hypothetical protein
MPNKPLNSSSLDLTEKIYLKAEQFCKKVNSLYEREIEHKNTKEGRGENNDWLKIDKQTVLLAKMEEALRQISILAEDKKSKPEDDRVKVEFLVITIKSITDGLNELKSVFYGNNSDKPAILTRLLILDNELQALKKRCESCQAEKKLNELDTQLKYFISIYSPDSVKKEVTELKGVVSTLERVTQEDAERQKKVQGLKSKLLTSLLVALGGTILLGIAKLLEMGIIQWISSVGKIPGKP